MIVVFSGRCNAINLGVFSDISLKRLVLQNWNSISKLRSLSFGNVLVSSTENGDVSTPHFLVYPSRKRTVYERLLELLVQNFRMRSYDLLMVEFGLS